MQQPYEAPPAPPKSSGSLALKLCGGCCLAFMIFCCIGAIAPYGWMRSLLSVEPATVTAVFTNSAGAPPPADYTKHVSFDLSSTGFTTAIVSAPDPNKLLLGVATFPPGQPLQQRQELGWAMIGGFSQTLVESGFRPPATDLENLIDNERDAVELTLRGETVEALRVKSTSRNGGVKTQRILIDIGPERMLIAAGTEEDFDMAALQAYLDTIK